MMKYWANSRNALAWESWIADNWDRVLTKNENNIKQHGTTFARKVASETGRSNWEGKRGVSYLHKSVLQMLDILYKSGFGWWFQPS